MIVVSDTSPIIALAAIGRLELLRDLYQHVVVPQAVYNEITVTHPEEPGARELAASPWIERRQVQNATVVDSLRGELDEGEAEAIALAHELTADLLLIDERKGRLAAMRLGLRVIGLMGVVLEAKQQHIVPSAKPVIDELVSTAGLWISGELYQRVLQAAGE